MVRADIGRLAVRRGSHQQTYQLLRVPVPSQILRGQPVQQLGMAGHVSLGSEIFFGGHQARAKELGPQAIDRNPSRQRVLGIDEPAGNDPTVGGRIGGQRVKVVGHARLHALAFGQEVPFDQQIRVAPLVGWHFGHDRHRRHGGSRLAGGRQLLFQSPALLFQRGQLAWQQSRTRVRWFADRRLPDDPAVGIQQLQPASRQSHVLSAVGPVPHDNAIDAGVRRQVNFPPGVVFLASVGGRIRREIVAVGVSIDGP